MNRKLIIGCCLVSMVAVTGCSGMSDTRITSYNVCYTKLLRAAGIGGHQRIGTGRGHIGELAVENLLTLLGELQAEGGGAAAAPARLLHLPQFDAGDGFEDP